jgi:hypothetical protein
MKRRAVAELGAGLSIALVVSVWPAPSASAVETPITISTSAVDFGDLVVGEQLSIPVQITNSSSAPFGPVHIFGGAPPSAAFDASQNCQGRVLAGGASCEISYRFEPTSPGTATDTSAFTISPTANQSDGESFDITLSGRGTASLTIAPTVLDFGNVAVGTAAQRPVVVTNTGAVPLGPLSVFGAEPLSAAYTALADCAGRTLAAGASCQIGYQFSPSTAGRVTDASHLIVSPDTSRDHGVSVAVAMTGCGPPCGPVARFQRKVTLALTGHLEAKGRVSSKDGGSQCAAGVKVRIQRRQGTKWRTVDTATTNRRGKYRESLSDRPGTYRASVAPRSVDAGAAVCAGGTSRPRHVR